MRIEEIEMRDLDRNRKIKKSKSSVCFTSHGKYNETDQKKKRIQNLITITRDQLDITTFYLFDVFR